MPASTPPATRLVVGLGNPGREYARSRHNVGFMAVDDLARRFSLRFGHRWSQAHVALGRIDAVEVALAKPQTYMNLSGESVRGLLRRLRLGPGDLLVVYDDLDLPFGRLRLRERGSSGGHRGVQSIADRLGTDAFARLRIGIGRPEPWEAVDYVLAEFSAEERQQLRDVLDRAATAIETCVVEGLAVAMNRFNR